MSLIRDRPARFRMRLTAVVEISVSSAICAPVSRWRRSPVTRKASASSVWPRRSVAQRHPPTGFVALDPARHDPGANPKTPCRPSLTPTAPDQVRANSSMRRSVRRALAIGPEPMAPQWLDRGCSFGALRKNRDVVSPAFPIRPEWTTCRKLTSKAIRTITNGLPVLICLQSGSDLR